MSVLKCVILDDETFAIELLADKIKLFPDLEIYKTYTSPMVALLEISEEDEIDILFLDIDMPGLTGIELGSKLRHKVKYLIFTTAFSKYAIDAFGIKAQDYLLKPIEEFRFIEAIQSILSLEKKHRVTPQRDLLFIKGTLKGKYLGLKLADLILIYVEGHKIFIKTEDNHYETTESLKNIESRLSNDSRFLRVHNSNIINVEKIVKIEGNTIEMVNEYKVPISENHKASLLSVIGLQKNE